MLFNTPSFIFILLPFSLIAALLIKKTEVRNTVLAAAGVVFYALGDLSALPVFLLSVLICYISGILQEKKSEDGSGDKPAEKGRRRIMAVSAGLELLILCVYKYLPVTGTALPLGISFFTFHAVSYIVDVYRRKAPPEKNLIALLLYISFFPRLISGPIVAYSDFRKNLSEARFSSERCLNGIMRFSVGMTKKLIIASAAAKIADSVFDLNAVTAVAESSCLDFRIAWLGALAYAIQIYYDFSGYSDMAIGLSAMLGFHCCENFDFPYSSLSLREFWRRWHRSLSAWFRDYLYIPLGGSRKGKTRAALNRMLVFLCTGLWHGAGWNYLLWGIGHGILVSLEGAGILPTDRLSKSAAGRIVCRLYTILSVVLLFAVFRAPELSVSGKVISSMFAFRRIDTAGPVLAGLLSPAAGASLLIGLIGSGTMMRSVISKAKLSERPIAVQIVCFSGCVLLFVLSLMAMSSGGFSPFIYAQF